MVQIKKIENMEEDDCLKLVLDENETIYVNSDAQIVVKNLKITGGNEEKTNNVLNNFGFSQTQNLLKFISNTENPDIDNFLYISSIFNGKIKNFEMNENKELIIATNSFLACSSNIEITEYKQDPDIEIKCLLLKMNGTNKGCVWINTFGKIHSISNENIICNKGLFVGIEKENDENEDEMKIENSMLVIPSNETKTIWLQTNNEYDFIKKLNNNPATIINKYEGGEQAIIAEQNVEEETPKEQNVEEETPEEQNVEGEPEEQNVEEETPEEQNVEEETPEEQNVEEEPEEQNAGETGEQKAKQEEPTRETGEQKAKQEEPTRETGEQKAKQEEPTTEVLEKLNNSQTRTTPGFNEPLPTVPPKGGKTKKRVKSIKKNKKIKQKSLRRKIK